MQKECEYVLILKAIAEIPFGVGKKLLYAHLQGDLKNESIKRNKLHKLLTFGSLPYDDDELDIILTKLQLQSCIELASVEKNAFWKVYHLTPKGLQQIHKPTLHENKVQYNVAYKSLNITQTDTQLFEALGPFLHTFTDEQKKAITTQSKNVLTIAGAGSGKTSVLTKRIDFLTTFRSINPKKILAITFTRKARLEMQERIMNKHVQVETFNSFTEKLLQQHNNKIYDQQFRIMSYGDKIRIVKQGLKTIGLTMRQAVGMYFTIAQQKGKDERQCAHILLNDLFFLRDYLKSKQIQIKKESFEVQVQQTRSFHMVISLVKYVDEQMKKEGLRDYSDQLFDGIELIKRHPDILPKYEHILVDEYQDVNEAQIELLKLLNPDNLFAVGDPRQSIFGWRGSDVNHILQFPLNHSDTEVIQLTKNFRSNRV